MAAVPMPRPAEPLRVAVIDDEDCVRKSVERLLRSAGMEITTFASGHEFLLRSGRRFDCLVLDVHMPLVDGFEVYEHFLRAGIRLPVVVITGHDSAEDRARAASLGIRSYLRKPIDEQVLIDAIAGAVREGKVG
jgi:FixJ family two-component response regulator